MGLSEEWRARLKASGRNDADLARALNRTKSAVSRIMTGDRKDLGRNEIESIEAALASFEGQPSRPLGLIPLLGYTAAGSNDHIAWALSQPIDWIEPPPMSRGNTDIVAIRVAGDSMEPRLFSGETVYVGLSLAPAKGGDAVVEFQDGTALVKSYYGRRDGQVFVRQYNPDKELRFPETSVKGLHAVLWRR